MSALLDLAAKVKSLTSPCRETDVAIYRLEFPFPCVSLSEGAQDKFDHERSPAYTASLDAAMTLVPEGWWVTQRSCKNLGVDRGFYHCELFTDADIAGRDFDSWEEMEVSVRNCAALPLALTAAALRARAALSTTDRGGS